MPRGNDADAAGQELEARLGTPANAEALIEANAKKWPAGLRAAQRRPLDDAATAALDEGAVTKALGQDEHDVLAYAVRGKHVIVVSEDEHGEVHKTAVPLDDLGSGASRKIEKAREDAEPAKTQPKTTVQAAEAGVRS